MKQGEMKFLPHNTGTNKLTATYETVKTHIEQYVQKTYKHGQDIAELLREENVWASSQVRGEVEELV